MKALLIRVNGQVQGVGFRWSAQAEARLLGLTGWVRNESDGSLLCLAQGPELQLGLFTTWLKHGPSGATVKKTEIQPQPIDPLLQDFNIRF